MRIYVPVTPVAVAILAAGDPLPATRDDGTTAFAVTPALRSWYGEDQPPGAAEPDEEDLEYVACSEAARACLRLLGADRTAVRRRVVLAVDVRDEEVSVRDDLDRGVVRTTAEITSARIAAVFVDDEDAEPAVARAVEVVDAADRGDVEAEQIVGDTEGFELSWYGPGELAVVDLELAADAS